MVPMSVKMWSWTMSLCHSARCTNSLVVGWNFALTHSSQTQFGCCCPGVSESGLTNFRKNPFPQHKAHVSGRSKISCDVAVFRIRCAAQGVFGASD